MQVETSAPTLRPRLTGGAADPIEVQRERARLAREAGALKRLQSRISKLDREGAIKHVERLLADKKTPVQYHAALISQLSELNMWKRASADDKTQISIGEMLDSWKREDAGAYAGLMNQHSVSETKRIGERSAGASAADGGGEPPISGTTAEALDPLTRPNSPEKVAQVAESNGVNANQPQDGWVE